MKLRNGAEAAQGKADKAKADKSVDAEGDAMDVDGRPVKRARSSSRARDENAIAEERRRRRKA